MTLQLLGILALSLAGLIYSGRLTIRYLTNVAGAFGLSEFTVAFIILAIATSLPEVFVGITSALQGASDIVLSTALGSNIVNITLIMGITALLSGGIQTKGLHLKRDMVFAGAISALPLLMLLNGRLGRIEAAILLLAFCYYIFLLMKDQMQYGQDRPPRKVLWGMVSILISLVTIGGLLLSSQYVVSSSVGLAEIVGVPTFLIGLFLLSIGTSLPELVTTIQSNRSGKPAMVMGNIIGSNIANSSLVLGIAALISPIETPLHTSLLLTMISVIVATALMAYLAMRKDSLSVFDGLKLLLAFLVFGIILFVTGAANS